MPSCLEDDSQHMIVNCSIPPAMRSMCILGFFVQYIIASDKIMCFLVAAKFSSTVNKNDYIVFR